MQIPCTSFFYQTRKFFFQHHHSNTACVVYVSGRRWSSVAVSKLEATNKNENAGVNSCINIEHGYWQNSQENASIVFSPVFFIIIKTVRRLRQLFPVPFLLSCSWCAGSVFLVPFCIRIFPKKTEYGWENMDTTSSGARFSLLFSSLSIKMRMVLQMDLFFNWRQSQIYRLLSWTRGDPIDRFTPILTYRVKFVDQRRILYNLPENWKQKI